MVTDCTARRVLAYEPTGWMDAFSVCVSCDLERDQGSCRILDYETTMCWSGLISASGSLIRVSYPCRTHVTVISPLVCLYGSP